MSLLIHFCIYCLAAADISISLANDSEVTLVEAELPNGREPEVLPVASNGSVRACRSPEKPFDFIVHWMCPVTDPLCVADIPFDLRLVFDRYRCATASLRVNNTVEIISAAAMLKLMESQNGNLDLPLCTLAAFYSPTCFFSAEMIPHLNALPRMFPRLRVVAVDASQYSKLNSRYGVVGTPTVMLWLDGMPAARMDEAPFSLDAFRRFIEDRTDLEGIRSVVVTERDYEGPLSSNLELPVVDWYLLLAAVSTSVSVGYFLVISKYGRAVRNAIRRRLLMARPT